MAETVKLGLPPASVGFVLGSLFDLERQVHVPPKRLDVSELHDVITQKPCHEYPKFNIEPIFRKFGVSPVQTVPCHVTAGRGGGGDKD
jgi:hypothetical protein